MKNGGVLLVCVHKDHGPCLVVFHNRSRHMWECPYGEYDGPPKHETVADTAAEELWEESCAQVPAAHSGQYGKYTFDD